MKPLINRHQYFDFYNYLANEWIGENPEYSKDPSAEEVFNEWLETLDFERLSLYAEKYMIEIAIKILKDNDEQYKEDMLAMLERNFERKFKDGR